MARHATVLPILLRRVRCSTCWFVAPQTMCGERICISKYWRGVFPFCPGGFVPCALGHTLIGKQACCAVLGCMLLGGSESRHPS